MGHKSGHDLARREIVVAITPGRITLPVGRYAVEMQIWERSKAFRLFIVIGRMWIIACQPRPRAVEVIGLAAVDDDVRNTAAQLLHDAPPAAPLSVTAGSGEIQESVIECVTGNSRPLTECDQRIDQPVLK